MHRSGCFTELQPIAKHIVSSITTLVGLDSGPRSGAGCKRALPGKGAPTAQALVPD